MTTEQVVTAKGDERSLLFAVESLDQRFDRRRQIVVTEPMRHPTKVFECPHMPCKKCFLLSRWKGLNFAAARVVEPHHEDLYNLLYPCQNHLGFSPVHLRILPWLPPPRAETRMPRFLGFAPTHPVGLDARFTADRSLGLQQLKECMRGVALLSRQTPIFL
jgi:hypothetical protein